MADQTRHGTHGNSVKERCPEDHELRAPNLMNRKDGKRSCYTCDLARGRARWRGINRSTPEWADLLKQIYAEVL